VGTVVAATAIVPIGLRDAMTAAPRALVPALATKVRHARRFVNGERAVMGKPLRSGFSERS
jgi:hypothetical protein